jgi:hypoxanthine phosphoribosyltransferase
MATQGAVDREVLTWPRFGDATVELAERIAGSGYRPDIVLAVAGRGPTVAGRPPLPWRSRTASP